MNPTLKPLDIPTGTQASCTHILHFLCVDSGSPANHRDTMSHNNGVDGIKDTAPHRTRHQITRSISELSSPIRLHRHHSHRAPKEKERDGLVVASIPATQGRMSLDGGSRSDGVTPSLSPNPSRRASILAASADDAPVTAAVPQNALATRALEDITSQERQKAVARERCVIQIIVKVCHPRR